MALAKKHKKHKHEEHVDESWLIPYADLLTLLLALFIVLFASSTVDAKKMQQMSEMFNSIFTSGSGVMDNPAPTTTINATESEIKKALEKYNEDQKQLQETQDKVENLIAVNELENQLDSRMTDEGLLITIRDSVLFDSGQADVKAEYANVIAQLAQILDFDPARNVIITGHTDNVPIANAQFSSNWELSVIRAVNFLKIIVNSNPNLDSKYFSVKGFGEFHPIVANDTAANRAKNRRVEVLVQPRVAEDGTDLPVGNENPISTQVQPPPITE